jgi:multiple sugar transport system substrate-binding protein
LLAACGGASEDLEAVPKTGTSEGKLVYGTWGAPERRETENWTLLAFEKNYSDLKVDVVWAPTAAEYRAKLNAFLAGGTPPDVIRLPSWTAPTFYYEDAVLRLDPYFRRDGFKTEALAAPYDVATYRRGWMALPRGTAGTWVVFYNRALLDRAGVKPPANGWTWDDFLAAARATTRPETGGQPAQWGTALEPLADFFYPWLWGNGGDAVDKNGQLSALDQPAAREALQWLADLRLKHKVAPPASDAPAGLAGFAAGQVALWYGAADAELDLAKLNAPDYGIAPQPKGKSAQTAGYKPDVIAIPQLSKVTDDAWELMQFLVDVNQQRLEFENGLWLPQSKDIVTTEAYQKPAGAPHDRRPGTPNAVVKARTPTIFPRGDDIRAAIGKALTPFWQGTRDVKDATDAATAAANAILNGDA